MFLAGFVYVMSLDLGVVLAGVAGAPVALTGAGLGALAAVRAGTVFVALGFRTGLAVDRSPFLLPGAAIFIFSLVGLFLLS